jgi:hypothetical protein
MTKKMIFRNVMTALMALIAVSAMAQPTSLSVNSETLYQHGYTSAGVVNPSENTDSVTIGSTTRYYVTPDATLNPLYTGVLTGTLASTFAWSFTGAGSGAGTRANVPGFAAYGNYQQINWTAIGTKSINAVETSSSTCAGVAVVTPVEVIAAPDVTSVTVPALSCPTGAIPYSTVCPNATLVISSSVNGNKGVSVNYSLTCSNAGFTAVNNVNAVLGNGTTLNLSTITLTHPGTYTLTINTVTDRIAAKSGLLAIADGTSTTFVLLPTPVTGPMYHVPNQ